MKASAWLGIAFAIQIFPNIALLHADVSIPAVIGDDMVLQRNTEVPIWGWADAGSAPARPLASGAPLP